MSHLLSSNSLMRAARALALSSVGPSAARWRGGGLAHERRDAVDRSLCGHACRVGAREAAGAGEVLPRQPQLEPSDQELLEARLQSKHGPPKSLSMLRLLQLAGRRSSPVREVQSPQVLHFAQRGPTPLVADPVLDRPAQVALESVRARRSQFVHVFERTQQSLLKEVFRVASPACSARKSTVSPPSECRHEADRQLGDGPEASGDKPFRRGTGCRGDSGPITRRGAAKRLALSREVTGFRDHDAWPCVHRWPPLASSASAVWSHLL